MISDNVLKTFTSGDGLLAFEDNGPRGGLPVVLLHSGWVDHTQYDNVVAGLIAEGHRVIAPDARGHGWSANATRPFRQPDDLAALLRHLDLARPAVLVGVSMGGRIALETALEHPEVVGALVVGGYGPGSPDPADPWSAAMAGAQAQSLAAGDLAAWLDSFMRWLPGPERTADDVDPAIDAHLREMAMRTLAKHTVDEVDHCMPVADVAPRLGGIAVPTLVLNGALDAQGIVAPAAALAAAIPGARSVEIPGAAHYPSMEAPEAYLAALTAFLSDVAI